MKNSLKRIPFMMAILSLMIFISCQTEENLVGKPLNPENTTLKFISKKDMMENKKVLKEYLNVEKKIELRKTAKMMYNSQYDFYMDTDKILYVENGDYNSYTIPIFRETEGEGKTENLVFNLEDEGYKTYIFRYNLSNTDKFNIANELTVDLTDKIEVLNMQANGGAEEDCLNKIRTSDGCYCLKYFPAQVNAQGQVTLSYVDWVPIDCAGVPGGGTGGGGNTTGGSSSGDGDSSGGNGDGGTDGGYNNGGEPQPGEGSGGDPLLDGGSSPTLITKPNVTIADPCLSVSGPSFYETLSDSQKGWWNNPDNFAAASEISNYIGEGGCNENSKEFAKYLIEQSLISGLIFDIEKSSKSPVNIDVTTIDKNTPEGQKFDCIYTKLMQSQTFKNLFLETFGNDNRLNVKFEIAETLSSPNAVGTCQISIIQNSSGTFYNNLIKIKRDILQSTNGIGNRSNVFIANTIIHELIHAYLNIKKINCNLGSSLTEINNMELGELIQSFYNNFNCAIDVDGSPQSQHDFMYNFMNSTFVTIFNEVKSLMISQNHINYAEQLVFQDSTLGINENWNWNKFFKYLALNGLHQCDSFVETTQNNPIENYLYLHYGPYANSFTKDCN